MDVSGRTVSVWGNAEHSASNYTYSQLGSTLTGASSGIQFGKSMDMDSTGTIWAIGDSYNTNVGSVRVYKYQNAAWSQMGSTINGSHGEDYLGGDVSISGDGKVLIVTALGHGNLYTSGGTRVYGYVNTYHYVNGDWVLFGETSGYNISVSIVPTTNHTSASYWGSLLSTNNDGTVVVIGEMNGSSKGGIWRYDSSSDSWNNEHIFSHNTSDVAMSRDGTRIVTGYEGDDTNGTNYGAIRVYDYNSSTQTWSQKGSTLTGYETYDRVGYRVAISGDGNTFFQCASNESSAGNSFAQVYTYIQAANGGNGDWVQKGTDFVGTTAIRYGLGSSLDYDGDTLILGSPNVDSGKVYKYINNKWEQVGPNFTFGGSSGSSTAVSDDGMTFAVGASGTTNGHAGAYILSTVEKPTLNIQEGYVGIGTTNPLATLHLDTGATYTDYANKGVLFNNLEYTNTHVRTTNGTQTASDNSWTRILWHSRKSGTDGSSSSNIQYDNGYFYNRSGGTRIVFLTTNIRLEEHSHNNIHYGISGQIKSANQGTLIDGYLRTDHDEHKNLNLTHIGYWGDDDRLEIVTALNTAGTTWKINTNTTVSIFII